MEWNGSQSISALRDFMRRNRRENTRQDENIRLYDGTDFGQWIGADVAQLIADGKSPVTLPIIKKAVDTIVGSIIADTMDTHFTPEYGEKNNTSIMLNLLHTEDAELGHYLDELTQTIRMAFIYRGWVEIFKDRSKDSRGRVGYRYRSGDQIILDPNWKTKRINDNKRIFIASWMTPQDIKDNYETGGSALENAIEIQKRMYGEYGGYGSQELNKLFDLTPEFYDRMNQLYLVYDELWLENTTRKRLFNTENQEFIDNVDEQDLSMFVDAGKAAGWNLEVLKEKGVVCKIKTGCPGLGIDLKLQSGDHPIQVNGYPFLGFSSDAINGKPNTAVDQLKDVQQSINKRETTITHILMTQAHDTLLIETDAVENPDTDIDAIGKGARRPGGYFPVAPGGLSKKKIGYLRGNRQGAPDFINASQHLREVAQELTPAVPAVQAVGEGPQSGILYQSKVAQAQVSMVIPKRNVTAFFEELGNAWFLAARQIYTYPMTLSGPEGKFNLNMPGGIYMKDLPRIRVTITQSPKSETLRRQMLQGYIATSQYSPDPLSKMILWRQTVSQMPDLPDDQLKELEAGSLLSEDVEILKKKIERKQLQQQLDVMNAPPQVPGQPMPGGSAPAPTPMPISHGPMPAQAPQFAQMPKLAGGQ